MVVRDWWDFDEGKPVTRGRVVWTGGNLAADKYGVTTRLYLGVWKNPHPDKTVTKKRFRKRYFPYARGIKTGGFKAFRPVY